MVVVRGRELVEQASQRLFRENVEHGIRMARSWNLNFQAKVQVASVDTLIARDQWPEADLVIVDECDQATSSGYQKLASKYPNSYFLGCTATPYTAKSLAHIAEKIVHPISMQDLVDQGFLVGAQYFAPSAPDLAKVRIENGEYNNAELHERMSVITGDIITHWKQLAQNRPTICFAVNIKHSIFIRDLFISQGIEAEHCDADTPDICRKALLRRLESGQTKVVCNVGILGRGVDIPFLGCIIMARPTRSYNLYIQQAGRGTRTHSTKKDFILLDHAGNVRRHGFITVEPPADLEGHKKKKAENFGEDVVICKSCYYAYVGDSCPNCGEDEITSAPRKIEHKDGVLKSLPITESQVITQFIKHCKKMARDNDFKPAWIYQKVVERFGIVKAGPFLPEWFIKYSTNPFFGSPYKAMK